MFQPYWSFIQEETLEDGERTYRFEVFILAPVKAAVLPLLKKDGLPEIAQEIVTNLQWDFNVVYDEKDAVGRRYRRQDAAGTPYCITVDPNQKEDGTLPYAIRIPCCRNNFHERPRKKMQDSISYKIGCHKKRAAYSALFCITSILIGLALSHRFIMRSPLKVNQIFTVLLECFIQINRVQVVSGFGLYLNGIGAIGLWFFCNDSAFQKPVPFFWFMASAFWIHPWYLRYF